jgi:hypothetical protein
MVPFSYIKIRRITLQVKKQRYLALVMTAATEVKLKKKCSRHRDFYCRYKAKVCKPDGIQHRTLNTVVVWDVMTRCVVDCTVIMAAAGPSETLVFMSHASWHSPATLTGVFPCFFLSCKANARVYLAKTGHGPRSS